MALGKAGVYRHPCETDGGIMQDDMDITQLLPLRGDQFDQGVRI